MLIKIGLSIISGLALMGFIGLVAVLCAYIADKTFKTKYIGKIAKIIAPRSYSIAFGLSLIATLASLFLSEVLHFQPCILCWYQRIAMYPQALLFYLALMRNERTITPYMIALNIMGVIVSLYHYSLHVLPRTLVTVMPCSTAVGGVPCDKGYNFYFGFMTFPFMAFIVYALILVALLFSLKPNKLRKK